MCLISSLLIAAIALLAWWYAIKRFSPDAAGNVSYPAMTVVGFIMLSHQLNAPVHNTQNQIWIFKLYVTADKRKTHKAYIFIIKTNKAENWYKFYIADSLATAILCGLPWRRQICRVELYVSVRQENRLHSPSTHELFTERTAKFVDRLRLKRRMQMTVCVSHDRDELTVLDFDQKRAMYSIRRALNDTCTLQYYYNTRSRVNQRFDWTVTCVTSKGNLHGNSWAALWHWNAIWLFKVQHIMLVWRPGYETTHNLFPSLMTGVVFSEAGWLKECVLLSSIFLVAIQHGWRCLQLDLQKPADISTCL